MTQVSRRSALQYLGLAALGMFACPATAAARKLGSVGGAQLTGVAPPDERLEPEAELHPAWQLVTPLEVGSKVAGLRLVGMIENAGSIDVNLQKADMTIFSVRICSREANLGGPTPIARTKHHDLFLINGGNGRTGTNESEGLAVMALGRVISRNECRTGCVATETIRERWLAHGAEKPQGAT